MDPKLLSIAGPLKNSMLAVTGTEFSIGRDPSNLLAVNDPSLSRRHCLLLRENGGLVIKDLESRNGTFVNGNAVQQAALRHGDQISIGDSMFILLLREGPEETGMVRVEFDGDLTHSTTQIAPQDALYLHPDRALSELPANSRLRQNLNALLRISQVVSNVRDLEQLQTEVLRLAFEVVPGDSGAVLLGEGDSHFASVFGRNSSSADERPVRISRTITQHVYQHKTAVLGADVPGAGGLPSSESLVTSQTRSVLCVPMLVHQKIVGCIYLQSSQPGPRFDEDHLQIMAAIAGISAVSLENARRLQWLEQENLRLASEINLEHNMVGDSPRLKELYYLLSRVAPTDSTVLLQGESGTGKELAAHAIHRNSRRSMRPFVTINCAAIPDGLLESELFGHEKGAFTGAIAQKKGRLELADGGTVFLDEIGELALALQVKLLRVLQEHEFERVGGTRSISVDVRMIAATNRNLEQAIRDHTFREDLYYRLNVVSLVVPPLRERREDVPVLAEYFVRKYGKKFSVRARKISQEAIACLTNYDWPGNVRELENTVQRALVLCSSDTIQVEDLPESILEKGPPPGTPTAKYHTAIKDLKKQLILKAVDDADGNYTEAARILGVHANYLHRLVRNLDLKGSLRAIVARE